jgi:hypothetical protein
MREVLRERAIALLPVSGSPALSDFKTESRTPVQEPSSDAVLMTPMIVKEDRAPDLFIRRENAVQEFFRTGTFVEKVGNKVTTKFWAKGDRGIMLMFSW